MTVLGKCQSAYAQKGGVQGERDERERITRDYCGEGFRRHEQLPMVPCPQVEVSPMHTQQLLSTPAL